jgi:hypothetical protein
MNNMDLWRDFDLSLEVDDVLRGQGADPVTMRTRRPALVEAAERALGEGLGKIHAAALVREVKVIEQRHERILLEGGAVLTGPLVARHLGGAVLVAAVICTLGPELEAHTARLFAEDPLLAMALDGLGNSAVEVLGQQVCGRIGARAQAEGLQTSTPLSPGSPEWPVEVGQPQIFALVEAAQAGIQITKGGMMIPQKSISFVAGVGADMAQTEPCEMCSLKEICRYRNA